MIVPSRRLIGLSAVVLTAASFLALWRYGLLPYALLGVGVFVTAVVMDAFYGKRQLNTLSVSSDSVIRMTSQKKSFISLSFIKPETQTMNLQVIPLLPGSLQLPRKASPVVLKKGRTRLMVRLECMPVRRGRYYLKACYVGQPTKMGLWMVRKKYKLCSEIRVYPNLVSGQKQILGLFRRKDPGWRNLKKIGKGREFEQLRDYLPGDSYEDIDWKATARRRYPITKDFEIEQSQEIYIILDASRLSTRAAYPDSFTTKEQGDYKQGRETEPVNTIFEHYLTGALTMAMAADRGSDKYGLIIFGSKPEIFLKAGRGKSHYNACMDVLYNYMPQTVSPDFGDLFAFIGSTIRKRSLLVFLTSLDDPLMSESFVNTMSIVTRKHVIMVNMLRPKGAYPLFTSDLFTSNMATQGFKGGDKWIYEKLLGHMVWSSLSTTRRRLSRVGAGFTLLNKNQLSSQLIDQYREVKQRQIV